MVRLFSSLLQMGEKDGIIISANAYGKLASRTGTSTVLFGYNGRDGVITDPNGLIYMRARYYSPAMKRFINADTATDIWDTTTDFVEDAGDAVVDFFENAGGFFSGLFS